MDLKDEEAYAQWLLWGTRAALALLLVSLGCYLSGLFRPHILPSSLPALWQLPLRGFLEVTREPTGWRWLALWREADFLTLGAITLLVLVTPLCYLQLTVSLVRRRRAFFAAMAALQFAVFAGAALLGILLPMAPA